MSNKPRTGVDHPFAIVPLELLTDVPATAVCVYVVLAECAHHDSGECWPSMATIADRIGKSEKAARRAVQALAESGWVTIRGAATEAGKQTSNRYFIYRTPPKNGTPTPPENGRVIPPENGRGSLPKMGDEPDPIEPDPFEPDPTTLFVEACSIDETLCQFLADTIERTHGKKPKITKAWLKPMRLLRERGPSTWATPESIPPDEITAMIEFALDHKFWSTNIQSPSSLRKYWERLRVERGQQNRQQQSRYERIMAL